MPGALIVNADDLGVTRGATLGIVRAHRAGIVSSASLAATTPAYGHAVVNCVRACPELGIGLHFTLTSGRPVSRTREVPLLVDREGFFRWRFLSLLRASASAGRERLLDEVGIELEAQLNRLASDGIRPDHIDGERHVHLIPGIFELVASAAARRGIPFMRLGRDVGWRHLRVAHLPAVARSGGMIKSWLLSRLAARARDNLGGGLRFAENLASYVYTGRLDLLLPTVLRTVQSQGLTEIMVHPGVPEESADAGLRNPALERYLVSGERRSELEACIGARSLLGGWTLTTFRRIADEA